MNLISIINNYLELILTLFLWLFIAFVFVIKIKYKVVGTPWETPLKYLLAYPFVIFDCLVNWMISPIFWQLPAHKFELVTGRMKRYKKIKTWEMRYNKINKFRFNFAQKLCNILNQVDKEHC